ncbi:hypothetical protein DFS34DRAFT_148480 [Phlyctochytrium arcticum]|nr:hypothetical protein DFS34DRAFT_148480 [Phlyctochytrium arcticum]
MKGDALSAALSTEGYGVSTTDRSTKNFAGNFGYMSFLTNGYMGMNYNNHASEPLPLPAEPLMATERRCSRPLKLSNSSYDPAVVYAKESSITSRPLHNMNADLLLPSPPSGVGDFQKLACGNLQATYGLQPAQTDAFPTPMPSTAPRQAQVKPSLLPTASIPSHLQYYPATNPHEIERLQKWIQEMDSGPSNSSVFAFSGQQSTLHAGNVLENGSLLSTNSCLPSNAPGAFDLSSFSSQAVSISRSHRALVQCCNSFHRRKRRPHLRPIPQFLLCTRRSHYQLPCKQKHYPHTSQSTNNRSTTSMSDPTGLQTSGRTQSAEAAARSRIRV